MSSFRDPVDLGKISVQYVDVFFVTANTETPVPHSLGGTVVGSVVVRKNKKCDIRDGQMPPASNVVQLVCDTDAVTATIRVEALNFLDR